MSRNNKILFLVPYPLGEAPSQRFRFEQYFYALEKQGIQYDVQSFISQATWNILYKPGHFIQKGLGILSGFLRRIYVLLKVVHYDFVFIHREASPIGPPIFEWIIAKLFRKKIIFDYDDAIWLPNTSENNKMIAAFKFHSKTASICKWAYKISCGNQYLKNYALKYNKNAIINPTTIDTINLHNIEVQHQNEIPVIGWTGTHSTIQYLNKIIPVIEKLSLKYEFKFLVISNRVPEFKVKNLEYLSWNKETEISDLAKMNIGIMPLVKDIWSEGKCGFKGLQYMALGIVALMSPVGVNSEIIQDGHNGFLANSEEEWIEKLSDLIENINLRKQMGRAGRITIEQKYSVTSNENNFLSLFE